MKMSEELEPLTLEKKFTSEAKELKKLTIAEASYLAGLIDGDGHIGISKTEKRNVYRLIIKVEMTHSEIINLCNVFSGTWHYTPAGKRSHLGKKPYYSWYWNYSMMKHYIPQILPYFRFKRDQAELLLEGLKCVHGSGQARTKQQDKQKLEQLDKKLKTLHHKSYPLPKKYHKI